MSLKLARLELRLLYQTWWAELRLVVAIVSADWLLHVMLCNELGSECCINMSGGSNVQKCAIDSGVSVVR
jgi:hypothetical protein